MNEKYWDEKRMEIVRCQENNIFNVPKERDDIIAILKQIAKDQAGVCAQAYVWSRDGDAYQAICNAEIEE